MKGNKLSRQYRLVIQSNSPLHTVAERLFFILAYLKNNPTQEYYVACFGMAQQQCGQWIHTLMDVLAMAMDEADVLPAQDVASFRRLLDKRSGEAIVHELIHDDTERKIPRPSDPKLQRENYSGKKKKHTVKNAVITCMAGFILFTNLTVEGKMHDKKIADTLYSLPYECALQQGTGYQSYGPANVTIIQLTKKPKRKELTAEQKAENAAISKTRVRSNTQSAELRSSGL